MDRVTISFKGGKLTISGKGKPRQTNRATLYLVEGNEAPVAQFECDGERHEALVTALDLDGVSADVDTDAAAEAEAPAPAARRTRA